MRCPNCQTLNPPNAKYCLECGNRLVVCPNCQTVNLPIAKFCIECGTALQPRGESTIQLSRSSEIQRAVAEPIATQLPPPEERRVVTVMFADITGSTPLADRLDPEDMRAILTGYFNLMTEQIRKHGGTVEKYIGDAVMAVFGAPIAHEDDPDRAIRAALDMQVALTTFNEQRQIQDPEATRLQMRIGINTGEVAAPSANTHQRQDFLITGDAVNVAARLQQVATPDTILVGERTYLSTREVFDFRPIASLHLKGKPEPIAAYVVLGLCQPGATITQHPRGIAGRQVPLVGRTLELTLMHANYARVQAERRPHLITILGSPGIGKSRLVREFISRELELVKSASSTGKRVEPKVLVGRCPPYGEGITYWPLIEILRSLLQVQEGESNDDLQKRFIAFITETLAQAKRNESADEIGNSIFRSIGRGLTDTAELPVYSDGIKQEHQSGKHTATLKQNITQVAMLRAWRVLFEALAEQQPLIIIIDDLQWADEALLAFLEYLTDRIITVPILFLCPARPDFFERKRDWGGGKRNFTTIELEALSREESSDLVDALLNTNEMPEVLRNTILARAEGNPFFVEEIVRMLIDQGLLVSDEDLERKAAYWHLGQPNTTVSELSTPGEAPDDSLLNVHYLLPLRVPDTIQGVLAARVDLLNPLERLVLQHAAIIGRTFWLSALLELASDLDPQTLQDALNDLMQRDLVIEAEKQSRSPVEKDHVFLFKHILIRDVVYSNIPRLRRSQEHAHLAIWLEGKTANQPETFIDVLAYHYQQALALWSTSLSMNAILVYNGDDPEAEPLHVTRPELRRRAITYLTLAGDQALHSYYTIRALQAYNDAFDLLVDSQADPLLLSKMHIKLGDAYTQKISMDEAWQEYRKALRLVTEESKSAEIADLIMLYERLAQFIRWLGWFDSPPDEQAIQGYIKAGLALLEGKPISRERVAFLTYQASWYIRRLGTAPYEQRRDLVEQALASGREALRMAEELNNPRILSLALDTMGFIYKKHHRYTDAHDMQQCRLKLENQLTEREELFDLYYSLGSVYEQTADYPTALMWFGRAWSNAQHMESPSLLLTSLTGRMRAWRQWNRWDNACQVAHEILQIIEQYQQDEKKQFWALETLATIAYRTGDQEQGDYYARQCKRLLDQQEEPSGDTLPSQVTTGMHAIHLASEDWTRATADYKEKLRLSEPFPSPEVLSTLAELLVMTGASLEEQEDICERAVSLGQQSGARKSLAVALRARGRMYTEQQNWELAEDNLRASLQLCEVLDVLWERANTLYYLGTLYKRRAYHLQDERPQRRNADWGRARYHFEQAIGFFEALKAAPGERRVRLALIQDTTAIV